MTQHVLDLGRRTAPIKERSGRDIRRQTVGPQVAFQETQAFARVVVGEHTVLGFPPGGGSDAGKPDPGAEFGNAEAATVDDAPRDELGQDQGGGPQRFGEIAKRTAPGEPQRRTPRRTVEATAERGSARSVEALNEGRRAYVRGQRSIARKLWASHGAAGKERAQQTRAEDRCMKRRGERDVGIVEERPQDRGRHVNKMRKQHRAVMGPPQAQEQIRGQRIGFGTRSTKGRREQQHHSYKTLIGFLAW